MKTKVIRIIKVLCFCIVFLCLFTFIASLFKPKWLENRWQSAKTNNSFYELQDNSIDVAFIGSSVIAAAVDPYQLYGDYGISSYNLGVMQQPMAGTYFWLKEILKTQSPKVVVVEVKTAGRVSDKDEADARKSYDYMKWGKNKLQYAIEYCNSNEESDLFEYLFPFGKYHTRWSELSEDDYDFVLGNNKSLTRGFATLTTSEQTDFDGIDINKDTDDEEYNDTNAAYLKRIIKLCKSENIDVVLTKSADTSWSVKKYKFVKKIADEYSVDYIDFNDKEIMQAAGIDMNVDAADSVHLNIRGAKKTTEYFGKYLTEKYKLSDYRTDSDVVKGDIQSEFEKYKYVIEDAELCMVNNIDEYLNKINKENYTVAIANGIAFNGKFTDSQKNSLLELGMSTETLSALTQGKYIISIMNRKEIESKVLIENEEVTNIAAEGYIGEDILYSISSSSAGSNIKIGTKEQAVSAKKVCLVVFDNISNQVADSVYLNVASDGKVTLAR